MKKYFAYARVSTEDQSDHSLENQLEYLKIKAEELNMLYQPYSEKASGKDVKGRTELKKILEAAQAGDFVGFYDNSRLGRVTEESLKIVNDLTAKGVNVQIGGQTFDSKSPRDELVLTIEAAISAFYRKEQRLKSEIGIRLKKQKGEWIFGGRLFGYSVATEGGKPVVTVIEKEAEILKFIFTEYAKGCSVRNITNRLNERGSKTREGRNFNAATVRRHLLRPIYIGKYLVTGAGPRKGQEKAEFDEEKLIESKYYTPIISEELWYAVNKSFRTVKRTHARQYKYRWSNYTLTGILRCYNCRQAGGKETGYAHSIVKSKNKDTENYVNRIHVEGCKQNFHTFRADILERLFEWCFYLLFMNDLEFSDYIEEKRKQQDEDDIRIENDIEQLVGLIDKINSKRKNFLDAIANGINQKHIKPEMDKLDDEEQELQRTIEEYLSILDSEKADIEDVADFYKENMLSEFMHSLPQQKRVILRRMIKNAWVFNGQLVIRFYNSKLYIIPLEKSRGRYVQTQFTIKTFFQNRYQYTFQYNYKEDELTLTDVPHNKEAWENMPDGFTGHHEMLLQRLKGEIERQKRSQ